jgi:iron complex outermembrane receptor protein
MRTLIVLTALALTASRAVAQDSTATRATGDTLSRVVAFPEVVVSTTRLEGRGTYAQSTVGREAIERTNWGQDTPMALATLPGVYAYSDAGNGIGYSYLSIRGFPQRRISVLVNGVPLNDPESHEVYWIDHPDLLASTAEAQVQRGVGSALYGAASLGGSVDIETVPSQGAPHFGFATGFGTFDTRRYMAEGNSGPIAGGWLLYGRYSRIETDGYRDQSDTHLWSYALSVERGAGKHWLRLDLFGGPEETHLAYLGIPQATLDGGVTGDADRDRRFNPLTYSGERDHFFEPHYEVIHSWAPSERTTFSQTLFYFNGDGFYDEQRFGQNLGDYRLAPWATVDSTLFPRSYYAQDATGALTQDAQGRFTVERFDVVRKRFIKDQHYGWVPRMRFTSDRHTVTFGGEIRAHDGHHIGSVSSGNGLPPATPPDQPYYDYHPRTLSAGLYVREEWRQTRALAWTADLAWRHQGYFMRDDRFDGVHFDQSYDFLLPRLGLRYDLSQGAVFAAAGQGRREPALRDLYDGEGVGNAPLLDANGDPLIKPERVNDYELGLEWRPAGALLQATLFRMDFSDELVYAGQFNTDLGYPIIGNAARSVHQGVELSGSQRWGGSGAFGAGERLDLALDANATLGDNHFVSYTEHYGPTPADDVSYDGKAIGFFPAAMGHVGARLGTRGVSAGLEAQVIGRIYVDNTESKDASIPEHTVLDLTAAYAHALGGSRAELRLRVLNLLDRRYATSGYMDYDASGVNLVPQFTPAATRSLLAELRMGW